MDVRYFLGERLDFTEQLYVNSAAPFIERKRKIEAEEEPFVPPYSEDPEPAFLSEWLEAEESLQVRGGSGWLDSLFPFLSGASRVADYAAVSRVVRLS
jgi:hypothetical protein